MTGDCLKPSLWERNYAYAGKVLYAGCRVGLLPRRILGRLNTAAAASGKLEAQSKIVSIEGAGGGGQMWIPSVYRPISRISQRRVDCKTDGKRY